MTAVGQGVSFWGLLAVLRGAVVMCSLWIVNQVLVRLWARRTSRVVSGCAVSLVGWRGLGAVLGCP